MNIAPDIAVLLADAGGPLTAALERVLTGPVLLAIVLAAVYGIFVGAIPGLTATMAVALLVPVTFFLDDVTAIAAIVSLEACCIFAGDIPTTLVRIPGTPASAAYTDDAYAFTRRGRPLAALDTSLACSVAGGLFGAIVLIVAAPRLAKVAFLFTTYEYFWMYALGLSCAAVVSHGSRLKGALSLCLGLLLATVGLSEVHSVPRFTFGRDELITGVNFIPAMIGLFGVSEVLRNVLQRTSDDSAVDATGASAATSDAPPGLPGEGVLAAFGRMLRRPVAAIRSSSLGTLIGMIPGAGADIGAWVSYAFSKRGSKTPQEYGRGSLEGIADATTANNAALAGAWIPALVFGVPGDSVTAIVIGVLLMKNVTPGPKIFADPQQSTLIHAIYVTFLLANVLLIPIGWLAVRAGSRLVRVPRRVLLPVILLFCIVGSFAINGSGFDVLTMLALGLAGFVLDRRGFPLGPVVLGLILGGQLEQSFVQNLTKSPSAAAFFGFETTPAGTALARPLSLLLGAACLAVWSYGPVRSLVRLARGRKPAAM